MDNQFGNIASMSPINVKASAKPKIMGLAHAKGLVSGLKRVNSKGSGLRRLAGLARRGKSVISHRW